MARSLKLQFVGSVGLCFLIFSLLGCHSSSNNPAPASDDFPTTADLLNRLKAIETKSVSTAPSMPSPGADFKKELEAFAAKSASLSPEDAAQQWLNLWDKYADLCHSMTFYQDPTFAYLRQPKVIFNLMPGPKSWPTLQKLIAAAAPPSSDPLRKPLRLFLIHTLTHNEAEQWADLEVIYNTPSANPGDYSGQNDYFSLGQKLAAVSEDPVAVTKFWERSLALLESNNSDLQQNVEGGLFNQPVPDFVGVLGEAKAEPLMTRLLLLNVPNVNFPKSQATTQLAQKIALKLVDKLKTPPWSLACSLDQQDLYLALEKKFGHPEDNTATAYHIMSYILKGKTAEATHAILTAPSLDYLSSVFDSAIQQGAGPEIYPFLQTFLAQNPQMDLWDAWVNVAAQEGKSAEGLKLVQDTLQRSDITPATRQTLQSILYKALLANDKIDEGVASLRALSQSLRSGSSVSDENFSQLILHDIQLADLGRLLQVPAWEKEGLDAVIADRNRKVDAAQPYYTTYALDELVHWGIKTGQDREAANWQIDVLVDQVKQQKQSQTDQTTSPQEADQFLEFNRIQNEVRLILPNLISLATIYDHAGRSADVLALLDQVPYWGTTDLHEITKNRAEIYRYSEPSLGLIAAKALDATGRTDQARLVLDDDLQQGGGQDGEYELFLKIGSGDLVAKLDELYQQDLFQNRPLIWKAKLLLQQGKIAEAEATCNQAISIDPSDGETGKGNRMRVYSVMAEVQEAKHNAEQAKFFRDIVSAIRLSEKADDFYDAGLLTRAVAMYQQALGQFSDAYCIQSRIARQLAALGRNEEAAAHYKKAFELMPSSFGRMESHCFGCERAFAGHTASSIAEQVFRDLMAKEPKNPRVPYLLGYLYKEQERYEEALPFFLQATKLDPDYINAWNQIRELEDQCHVSSEIREETELNLLRLDPQGRHYGILASHISNLEKLWLTVENNRSKIKPLPESVLPLTASAAHLQELKDKSRANTNGFTMEVSYPSQGQQTPQELIQDNDLFSEITSLMQ